MEYVKDSDIYGECKKYKKTEVLRKLLEGTPINDFKYMCCQKQIFEKGEILSSHSEIESKNITEVNMLSDNNYDKL